MSAACRESLGNTDVTMGGLCRNLARNVRDSVAFIDGAEHRTFGAFDAVTSKLASALNKAGVGHGDRLAAIVRDGLPLLELYFAAAKLGAIVVPVNWRLAPGEIAYILQSCRPHMVFVSERFKALGDASVGDLARIDVPDACADKDGEYARLLATGDTDAPQTPVNGLDPWMMLYTSGTTGRPKGCLLSHRGQAALALNLALSKRLRAADCALSSAPLFHVGGLSTLLAHFLVGARNVIAPHPIDTDGLFKILVEHGCTETSIPATLRAEAVRQQRKRNLPLKLERLMTAGTSMVDMDSFLALKNAFAADLHIGYGQTEAGGFASFMSGSEQIDRPAACGKILRHLEVKIVDGEDRTLPIGEAGELCLRGPSVMLGYWEMPEASAETLRGGWLHTGDIFKLDEEGYIHFAGRKKELIKSGGENVYPAEVEQALMSHAAIRDSAVVGVPDSLWGEAVKAFVVLEPGATLSREDIVAWCRKDLAGYKRPRYIEFIDAIPRSVLGKIERLALARRPVTPDQAVK